MYHNIVHVRLTSERVACPLVCAVLPSTWPRTTYPLIKILLGRRTRVSPCLSEGLLWINSTLSTLNSLSACKPPPWNFITGWAGRRTPTLPSTTDPFVFKRSPLNSLHRQASSGPSLIFTRTFSCRPQTAIWSEEVYEKYRCLDGGKINRGGAETWASLI